MADKTNAKDLEAKKTLNEILVHLFNEIWDLEEKAIITDEFRDITNNDMHIIAAIGLKTDYNMSAIAKKMRITLGSLTTAMNSLVNKGYVIRSRSHSDRRIVHVRLTQKGKQAYFHHQKFHEDMVNAVLASLKNDEEVTLLTKSLDALIQFFKHYQDKVVR